MRQSGISFEQQGAWEEAIVTVLAHTVHAAWKMLAEHERIITIQAIMVCDRALPHGFRKMGQYMKLHGWTTILIG